MPLRSVTCAAALIALALPASANEFEPMMQAYLDDEVRAWSTDDVLLSALRAQNATTAGYDQGTIDSMDQAWRAEVGAGATPTIDPVITNAAAAFLRD